MTIDTKMGRAKRDVSKQNRPKPVGTGSRGQSTVFIALTTNVKVAVGVVTETA